MGVAAAPSTAWGPDLLRGRVRGGKRAGDCLRPPRRRGTNARPRELRSFRRGLRPARLAGLGVAGLAVVKVLVFDLSSLDALYRVGSVFILGLVFLLLAYLYHRQGRTAAESPESAS